MPPRSDTARAAEPRVRTFMRKAWRKVALRNVTGNDNHEQLDRLYAMPDPWNMASPREAYRFTMTDALIEARLGHVGTILELGCGEGHQSQYLAARCDHLVGLDVSPRAVARARARVPDAQFAVGALAAVPWTPPRGRFDLVVACEVLYYMRDISATVARMSELGDACLVTFFGPSAKLVAPHVDTLPGGERGWFHHDPYTWLWAFWRPERRG